MSLLNRVALQDQIALKALYDLTSPRLYGLALRMTGQAEHAERVLQDSFVHIWRTAPDYRASLNAPMTWMTLIVRHRALETMRRVRADGTHLSDDFTDDLAQRLRDEAPMPLDRTQTSPQAQALHGCLTQIDKSQRDVISLAYLRDLGHAELAHQLHQSPRTVRAWIRHSLDELRGCMARVT
jgi:RNA polymerase sigma-70 factor (ECF subfamily)